MSYVHKEPQRQSPTPPRKRPSLPHTLLITGFGPFPGVPHNASGVLARNLAHTAKRVFPNISIVHANLHTEWKSTPTLLDTLVQTHRPNTMLLFGVSHQAKGFVVETSARNAAASVDAAGELPLAETLIANPTPTLRARLSAAQIVARLNARDLPARISHDAGTYLCNAAYFHALRLDALLDGQGRCIFVHLPANLPTTVTHTSQTLSFHDAVHGGLEIIATLLKRPLAPHPKIGRSKLTAYVACLTRRLPPSFPMQNPQCITFNKLILIGLR